MESNPIHLPYAQRLQNKVKISHHQALISILQLDFLEKTKTFNFDQHQKESIQNQLDVFIKLAQNIKVTSCFQLNSHYSRIWTRKTL